MHVETVRAAIDLRHAEIDQVEEFLIEAALV